MALPPDTNVAFLREVDDEVRRDRLTNFWTKWGLWSIAGVVAALALLGGFLFWQHRSREAAGAEGEQLQTAFDALGQGQFDKAAAPLKTLAGSDAAGYRALAKFTQADLLLQKQDLKGAAAIFASVATDTGVGQPFRDLALIRQTAAEYDTLKPQTVVERMRPLAVPGNPWLGSAGEMMALAQIRLGQQAQAGQLFGRIARDEGVPDSLRQRAVQMAGVLGVDALPSGAAGKPAGTTNQDSPSQ
ncbi:hypothetical protein ASG67_10105 [Sphingomonas sp. Leaf339]|uniref:tetratricopeptide repeat protein n=1 Tax=Sphingomonas sp. Leaf339 TaxID=1736343 RepID=UPI0006F64D19|nr:tetratricopeptide repeat protein [Sphingomonas sp. Leaf339]KQU53166.1 hypothetical protein ASG67_10105 [Sphingomonas sp. Leaf339]